MIIKVKKGERPFFQMEKQSINDSQLSYKARGILAYLISKPDDWEINVTELERSSEKDGRDSVRSGLKELEQARYLMKERVQDKETGHFKGWEYVLYETPQPKTDFPNSGKPTSGYPNSENPTQLIMSLTNNDLTNIDYYDKGQPANKSADNFSEEIKPKIYSMYRKVFSKDMNQINAKKIFDYLEKVEPGVILIALEQTAVGNGKTLSYTISVLEKLIALGYKTEEQARDYYSKDKTTQMAIEGAVEYKTCRSNKSKWELGIDFNKFREN